MIEFLMIFPIADAFLAAALALSLLVTCKCVLQLVVGKSRTPWWVEAVFVLAAIVTISVLTIDAIQWIESPAVARLSPLPGLAVIALAMLAAWLQIHGATLRLPASELRGKPAAWALLAAGIAAGCWSSYRFQSVLEPPAWDPPPVLARPVNMEQETQFVGLSDRGREIPLFRSSSAPIAAEHSYHLGNHADHPAQSTVIARGAPDTSSNCYGWVFTDGEFLLDTSGIKTILDDNGYSPCEVPQPGDVIIYFIADGVPIHTGLVSGVLSDGTVIVESKWGLEGRFLHRPQDQPYSETFTYYRSQRAGNAIIIQEKNSTLVKQRLPGGRRIKRA